MSADGLTREARQRRPGAHHPAPRARCLAAVAVLAAMATACQQPGTVEPVAESTTLSVAELQSEAATQPDDLVDLTLYFRGGTGPLAHLVPVVREVPVTDDLPRTALELLLVGPADTDGDGLTAPLPTSTTLRDLTVDGGTAIVDLSADVITDAGSVGDSPEHESLALGALVDTLTEFPFINQVALRVEGQATGDLGGRLVEDFWGGWGLPAVLVRDESLIGPIADGDGVRDLDRFTGEPQAVGSEDAPPVDVTSVRARQRTTYLRVGVELADAADPEATAAVPTVRALAVGETIVLDIGQVGAFSADFVPGQRLELGDAAFDSVTIEPADLPGTIRIVITPAPPAPGADVTPTDGSTPATAPTFWLHTLSSPTRVVLDVRK